jgi:hypothetical protein
MSRSIEALADPEVNKKLADVGITVPGGTRPVPEPPPHSHLLCLKKHCRQQKRTFHKLVIALSMAMTALS